MHTTTLNELSVCVCVCVCYKYISNKEDEVMNMRGIRGTQEELGVDDRNNINGGFMHEILKNKIKRAEMKRRRFGAKGIKPGSPWS